MSQGKIIEFIEDGRILCALCLQDKGSKWHLLLATNRETNLAPKRALLTSQTHIDPASPREEILERLRRTEQRREELKRQVNPAELSELVRDEAEDFDHRYLAQLVFGEDITDDHLSGLVRALFEDRLYFRIKDGRFKANPLAVVEQIRREREAAEVREERLKTWSAWLKAMREGKRLETPPAHDELLALLVQVALQGEDAPDIQFARQVLTKAGCSQLTETRHLLVQLGAWDENENLDLLRLGTHPPFAARELEAAAQIRSMVDIWREKREDLRALTCVTIDGATTRDHDDAVSLSENGGYLELGVHIADVAALIAPAGLLDQAAAQRTETLYLPGGTRPMLPPVLSEDTLSLKEGCDRPALSLLARLDPAGNLLGYRLVPSWIRVTSRLTYEGVDAELARDPLLARLHALATRLKAQRMERGALRLSLPEVHIEVPDDGRVRVTLVDQDTPAKQMVAELMILYNALLAQFCQTNGIPGLYRTQAPPAELVPRDEKNEIFHIFQQRRKLRPLSLELQPAPHALLGLEAYIQASSPIRRYLDLVAQQQVGGFLARGACPYDPEALERIRMQTEPVLKSLARMKQNRMRYWILKYLQQNSGERYAAVVSDELKSRFRLILLDFLLYAEIKKPMGRLFRLGEEVMVKIVKSDPWNDVLELSLI